MIGEFKSFAKEAGLTPELANKLLKFDTELAKKLAPIQQKAAQARLEQIRTKDVETLKADKEFGGAKYDETVRASRSAMTQFFGEAGSAVLKATGLDNHPDIVRGLAKLRKAILEDQTPPPGNGTPPPAKDRPQTGTQKLGSMFDRINSKKKK